MAEILATFAIENGLNITRQAMKKTKIKFLIIAAAFGFIFFFVPNQVMGCCIWTAGIPRCDDSISTPDKCEEVCKNGYGENCTFSISSCAEIQGCPQAELPDSPDKGCCYCLFTDKEGKVSLYKCFGNYDESSCQRYNNSFPPGSGINCQLSLNKGCRDVPECSMVTPPPTSPPKYEYEPVYPKLQIPIPGIPSLTEFAKVEIKGEPGERYVYIPWIGQYISAIYGWAMGIVGILAVAMIIWGGVIYLTAGGSPERISTAKSYIASAITGLILAFGSYLLLYTINPDLVKFAAMKIRVIERVEFLLVEEDIGRPRQEDLGGDLVTIEDIDNIVFAESVEIKKLRSATKDALKKAAEILKNQKFDNEPIVLQINHATRSYEGQLRLYKNSPKGRACFPRENEYNCPHVAGIAVDAVCKGKRSDHPCQEEIKKAMFAAGFCRYKPEAWHFEFPKMSRNCVKE